MLRGVTLSAGAALLSGCGILHSQEPMVIEEVASDLGNLDGSRITIRAYLGAECAGYDCRLHPTIENAESLRDEEAGSPGWTDAFERSLNICIDDEDEAIFGSAGVKALDRKSVV